jgi:hypothetical protein
MNLLALAVAVATVALYVHAVWQERVRAVPAAKLVEQKLIAGFLFLGAVSMLGSRYTLVEHGATIPSNATPAMLWIAFLLAVPQCALMGFILRRRARPYATMAACMSYLVLGVFNIGFIQFVNGALDSTPPQRHMVRVVGKRFLDGNGKSSPRYVLQVTDWAAPGQTVPLAVKSSRYRRTGTGARIELEIGKGLLGMEWVREMRFL